MTDSGPMFSGITTFVDNSGFTFGVGGGTSIFTPATNVLTFGTNSNERLRITSTGRTSVGSNNQSYGRLQVNQTSDDDEAGFAVLNSNNQRSLRLYCDSSNNAVFNSGNAGSGQINFNEGKVIINSSGHLLPGANLTYNLGASSSRWSNIYGGYLSCFITQASTYQVGEFRNEHSTYGGGVRFKSNNTYGSVEIMRYDGTYGAGLYNSTGGWHWDSNLQFHGSVTPWTNNTYNLGSSSKRWANLYVNDAHFSNEGSTNSVDGTWGDWTLQEGENDIYMINNRNGKKYKINLTEV